MKRISIFTILIVMALLLAAFIPGAKAANGFLFQNLFGAPSALGLNQSYNPQNAFIRMSSLKNFDVKDLQGNLIGTATDFVVNLHKSRIDFIVTTLSSGRTVLLPWASLSGYGAQNNAFIFKDNADRLKNAPDFNASSINFNLETWSQDVLAYWATGSSSPTSTAVSATPEVSGGSPTNEATSVAPTVESMGTAPTAGATESSPTVEAATSEPTSTATAVEAATATPEATTAVATGSSSSATANVGLGAVAILASQLINQPVYNLSVVDARGQLVSSVASSSPGVPTTGGSAQSMTATPEATASSAAVETATPEATTGTSNPTAVTPEATATTASTPAVSSTTSSQASSSDQVGTVSDAIVNTSSGFIPYLLIASNQSCAANAVSVPNTGSSTTETAVPTTSSSVSVTETPASATETSAPTMESTVAATTASTSVPTAESTTVSTQAPTMEPASPTAEATSSGTNASASSSSSANVLVPVPFNAVFRSVFNDQVVLRVSPAMLSNAPVLDMNKMGNNPYFGWGWDQNYLVFWNNSNPNQFLSNGIAVTGGCGGTVPTTSGGVVPTTSPTSEGTPTGSSSNPTETPTPSGSTSGGSSPTVTSTP